MLKLLAGLALLLPGLCWWTWWGDRKKDPVEALAGILGISISVITLLSLFFYLVKVPITVGIQGGLIGFFLAAALVEIIRTKGSGFNWGWLAALLAFGLLVAWRFWQARELVLPAWVDSLHHVLIVRKMVEAGGLVGSLEPYLPGPFYYHYAFHAVSAAFSALSGLDPAQSVLLVGQVISAGISLSVYALVKTISRDWRTAALAGLMVAFATKMPGYYLTWGRYTMLTGMLMLPLAMAEALSVQRRHETWKKAIGLTLLTAGTLLSHYLSAFLLAVFLLILGLGWLIRGIKRKNWDWKEIMALVLPVLLGLGLVFPWYRRVFTYSSSTQPMSVQVPQTLQGFGGNPDQWQYLHYLLGPETGYALLALAGVGLVWALGKPAWRSFGVWSLALMLLSLPLGLQIASFRSDLFGLTLFLAVTGLSAGVLIWALDWLASRSHLNNLVRVIGAVLLAVMLELGGWQNKDVLNSDTILVTKNDLTALNWIEEHTPTEARFFINTASWGYDVYRGVDGGAWILPYTGRFSLVPTIFYPFGGEEETIALWKDWGRRAASMTTCSADFWQLVGEAQLNYIYLREGVGSLSAAALQGCEGIKQLYSGSGVSIWLIEQAAGGMDS